MTRVVNKVAIDLHATLAEVYEALYERASKDHLWLVPDDPSDQDS